MNKLSDLLEINKTFKGSIKTKKNKEFSDKFKILKKYNDKFNISRISDNQVFIGISIDNISVEEIIDRESNFSEIIIKSKEKPISEDEILPLDKSGDSQIGLPEKYKKKLSKLKKGDFSESVLKLIHADIKNILMVGPSGTGKTVVSEHVADILERKLYIVACGAGTSPTTFKGKMYPERELTIFPEIIQEPSVVVLDEFTTLDPAVAQICNSFLANDIVESVMGIKERHPDCIVIATANTFGHGGNLQYIANNQLDGSTLDRFKGGMMKIDYSKTYEKANFDNKVVEHIWKLRQVAEEKKIGRIISTRMIKDGEKLMKAGFTDWKKRILLDWSDEDLKLIKGCL